MELYVSLDTSEEINNDVLKEDKKVKKTGLLKWLKLRVSLLGLLYDFMILL